jgi:hypothetical protein
VSPSVVTAGGAFAHAIGSDGNLYGWGEGSSGQVGIGIGTLTPVVVPLASGVTPKTITDNLHTGYALGSDGNIYAWGYGLRGEFGNGSTGNDSPPVVVSLPPGSTVKERRARTGFFVRLRHRERCQLRSRYHHAALRPSSDCHTNRHLDRSGEWFSHADGAVAGLD